MKVMPSLGETATLYRSVLVYIALNRMKTPVPAIEWLQEKCDREHWGTVREARSVTREWVRYNGGRVMRAGLSGAVAPSREFELLVLAPGVHAEYVAAVRNAAITVLISQSWSPIFLVKLTLSEFMPHASESSYAAFYAVAHEVVCHLVGVAPDTQHNIEW